jgi:ribosomal protein S4E
MKRINAPKHWMLDKMGGVWAPKPSAGPHKTRECVPLIVLGLYLVFTANGRRQRVESVAGQSSVA